MITNNSVIEIEALTYLCTLPTEHRAGVSESSSLLTSECWDPGASGSGASVSGGSEPKAFSEASELEDLAPVMSTLELASDVDDSDSEDSATDSHEVSELEDNPSFRLRFSASMADDKLCGLQFVIYVRCENIVNICELLGQLLRVSFTDFLYIMLNVVFFVLFVKNTQQFTKFQDTLNKPSQLLKFQKKLIVPELLELSSFELLTMYDFRFWTWISGPKPNALP